MTTPSKRPNGDPGHRPIVVLAEDDDDYRSVLAAALEREGFLVVEVRNGVELVEELDISPADERWRPKFDVLVTDYHMPGITGMEVLEALAMVGMAGRVIVISAFADDETMEWASRIGAASVLAKPFSFERLTSAIRLVIANS